MPVTYRAALVGCSRMGAFIDNEMPTGQAHRPPPYSHAAGYEACQRTDLVACSDVRPEVLTRAGCRYHVPPERQYSNYQEMIKRESPDILSVATQPEQRAEVVIFAAENGVKAIYAEKAMAASLEEADAMVESVERNGVVFNMGTNRRWDSGYNAMKSEIESGRVGPLKTLISHQTGTLFNTASHIFDLLMRLNSDVPVTTVQAHLTCRPDIFVGDTMTEDPSGYGTFLFENGVIAHALNTGRGLEIEAICERGVVTALGNGASWSVRETDATSARGKSVLVEGEFPQFRASSSTLNLIEDLVQALDNGGPTAGGVRVARDTMELIFAFVRSHRNGGRRVDIPDKRCGMRLQRAGAPRNPMFERG